MQRTNDTIAAIATAPGEAGIAIVRVSGPESLTIADQIFLCRKPPPSQRSANSFVYGHVHLPAHPERIIDEAILLIFRAPHSYTGEDVAEIQCHGGRMCPCLILRAVTEAGARIAEPGEFTKRAFMNGRIDLVKAEAVLDLIKAKTERATECAIEQLSGRLSESLTICYNNLVRTLSNIEAWIDFEEDDGISVSTKENIDLVSSANTILSAMSETWGEGLVLRDGLKVVIAGRPNAGKSTLFNKLVGCDRAIVTEMPGTTRDVIEEMISLDGIPIRIFDTAGIREPECVVERLGVERARSRMNSCDLLIYVVDASLPPSEEDARNLAGRDVSRTIVVLNKIDLGRMTPREKFGSFRTLECSLINSEGLRSLKRSIGEMSGVRSGDQPHAVINERHRSLVLSALENTNKCLELLQEWDPRHAVPAATLIRSALESISSIIGTNWTEDMLNEIFSRFCVGK